MNKLLYFLLFLPILAVAQPIYPPATQTEVNAGVLRNKFVSPATLEGWNGGSTNLTNIVANLTTNIPVFGAVYGTGAAGTNGQPYTIIWPIHGVNTNVSTNATTITVQKDGFYQVGAIVSFKATNDDTFYLSILTNGVEHTGLRSYVDYAGANAGAALATNFVSSHGLVYALSNTAFTVQLNWHLSAAQALTNLNRAFFVNKINTPPGGGVGGGGSGSTETQWIPVAAQFATNSSGEFVIKNGATVTNLSIRAGLALPTLTASRVTFVDANGNLTNVTSASASTDFVHADGSVGTVSGTPGGSTADMQFNEGGAFAGTNRLRYIRAENSLQIDGVAASSTNGTRAKIVFTNDSSGAALEVNNNGISLPQSTTFQISSGPAGGGHGTNILLIDAASIRPAVNDSLDFGNSANRAKALWVTRLGSFGSMFTTGYVHSASAHVATEFSTTNSTPGSATAALTLSATNLTQAVRIQGAHQMTRLVTNIVGILEVATNDIASAVFTIDCDKQHEVNMTNRIGFAFTTMVTNGVPGQRIKGRFIGTASGGANHIVTFAGQGLFLNSYDISANPATSLAVTVTNGYLLEYDIAINKDNGTNTFDTIYAYKKY